MKDTLWPRWCDDEITEWHNSIENAIIAAKGNHNTFSKNKEQLINGIKAASELTKMFREVLFTMEDEL